MRDTWKTNFSSDFLDKQVEGREKVYRQRSGKSRDRSFIIPTYLKTKNVSKTGEILGFSSLFLLKFLKEAGISTKYNHSLDDTVFETINTEEKAYWLGFLTADGYIREGASSGINLRLQLRDKDHIIKFQKFLSSDHKLQEGNTKSSTGKDCSFVNLAITNIKLSNDLVALGLHQNKSKTAKPCDQVPSILLKHYYRGLIDGDGSLTKSSRDGVLIGLCGTYDICRGFLNFVKNIIGIQTSLKIATRIDGLSYLRFSKNPSKEIIKFLYQDAKVSLDRKQAIAYEVINASVR